MERILIIEDDLHIGDMVARVLTKEGYAVSRSYSGTEALFVIAENEPDLVLLDLMLPGFSGEELLDKLSAFPVIVVSAKADVDSRVELLNSGAVDYITKPFDVRELLARIKIALKNKKTCSFTFGDLKIDPVTKNFYCGGKEIRLTRTEYAIIKLLIQNPAQVIAKHIMLEEIARDTPDCTESSLKVHISNLRRKLREAGGNESIETVWAIGFKLKRLK